MYKYVLVLCALATTAAFVIRGTPAPSDESGSAVDKFEAVWSKVAATQGTRGKWPSLLSQISLLTESMAPSVDHVGDEFPAHRSKLVHAVGVVAKVQIQWDTDVVNALQYTGLFQSASYGILRASSATQPDFTKAAAKSGFVPSVGLKFFRSGVPSANFVVMHILKAWDSFNWFKYALSTHVSTQDLPMAQQLLGRRFATVSAWGNFVGMSDFATFDEEGNSAAKPGFPFQILLVPNPLLTAKYTDDFTEDYFTQFVRDVKAGTPLYAIYAIDAPEATPVQVGTVVTASDFITSSYADKTLFLKHQIFEEDLAFHPEWTTGNCPTADACLVCPVDTAC